MSQTTDDIRLQLEVLVRIAAVNREHKRIADAIRMSNDLAAEIARVREGLESKAPMTDLERDALQRFKERLDTMFAKAPGARK